MNQLCGSGLSTAAPGARHIAEASSSIVVTSGQESVRMAPHAANMRAGSKMGEVKFIDTMFKDGLINAFYGYHMGATAENVSREWQMIREEQNAFALPRKNKAETARRDGRFKNEIMPVIVNGHKGDVIIDMDKHIKEGVCVETLAQLCLAFDRDAGTVTVVDASGINDGAPPS